MAGITIPGKAQIGDDCRTYFADRMQALKEAEEIIEAQGFPITKTTWKKYTATGEEVITGDITPEKIAGCPLTGKPDWITQIRQSIEKTNSILYNSIPSWNASINPGQLVLPAFNECEDHMKTFHLQPQSYTRWAKKYVINGQIIRQNTTPGFEYVSHEYPASFPEPEQQIIDGWRVVDDKVNYYWGIYSRWVIEDSILRIWDRNTTPNSDNILDWMWYPDGDSNNKSCFHPLCYINGWLYSVRNNNANVVEDFAIYRHSYNNGSFAWEHVCDLSPHILLGNRSYEGYRLYPGVTDGNKMWLWVESNVDWLETNTAVVYEVDLSTGNVTEHDFTSDPWQGV